jgi:hypothetical protein
VPRPRVACAPPCGGSSQATCHHPPHPPPPAVVRRSRGPADVVARPLALPTAPAHRWRLPTPLLRASTQVDPAARTGSGECGTEAACRLGRASTGKRMDASVSGVSCGERGAGGHRPAELVWLACVGLWTAGCRPLGWQERGSRASVDRASMSSS